ncbi:UDP-2,4-diacetamido-2,4,6-trideoxy-beta-L-altropyranose hydrolase [Oceanobacillus polygoni]|uniref:UDP-2,4-diacetamido-2,4, 6-trideoxy-beta-L-altropyranose hydrolase n=1 Tax=Oceanobacillus polygoni TaxID=1235259 RepID=A0A9X1CFZ5_9BACI|nr:UDP-2,4-diacetamido-2,4,6-trideoxy-beta-L-altropyranose hydrolase [Oceanobacillus polygoni]MBP2077995.1 UDP-2,4-diacetamido-2,4,6-trideoxy-beta-L-altropyranose hydrolase [Oceanobacillus polygoni]
MKVFIRTDASTGIGTGHVMRCLVLAEELRKKNVSVTFVCRRLSGNLIEYIKSKSFTVISLPTPTNSNPDQDDENWLKLNWKTDVRQTINAIGKQPDKDWLIIDHYAIDKKWERTIKPMVKKLMVIDDLANRQHDCDLLLDQNLYRNLDKRYEKWIPSYTTTLLGPTYLLLRQEFRDIQYVEKKSDNVKRILISFGGSDPTNETMKAIKAIKLMNQPDIAVDIVIGFSNQNYSAIKKYCEDIPNIKIHYQIDYLAELMAKADLAIGAGGSTTWERCYVRLPAITIETATNQSEILSYLSEIGVICHLGLSKEVAEQDIANQLMHIINNPEMLKGMMDASKLMMRDFNESLVVDRLLEENNDD